MLKLTPLAMRLLLFKYIQDTGKLPPWDSEDQLDLEVKVFNKLTGSTKSKTLAAYAELEDAGMIEKVR